MLFNLEKYALETSSLVRTIKASFDPESELHFARTDAPVIGTRLKGSFRRNRIVLLVKEYFNYSPENGTIDKEYRYRYICNGEETLRIETEVGKPEHAHFSPRYTSGSGRHFDIVHWTPDLQDMNFIKAFALWSEMVRTGGLLPEPFRSAK